jgi:Mg-chelatase subunit ChlD
MCKFNSHRRRGVILYLVLASLAVLIAAAAFSVDVAYMHLVRSQLRVATDAAARAGAEALHRTQNEHLARLAAKRIARRHVVAGKPLVLQDSEIVLGSVRLDANGRPRFQPNQQPYDSVMVLGNRTRQSANGAVPLLFGPLLGTRQFEPTMQAVAGKGRPRRDICLVLDRSHSMAFDLSDKEWYYPANAIFERDRRTGQWILKQWDTQHRTRNGFGGLGDAVDTSGRSLGTNFLYYQCPVHPTLCRWAALAFASVGFFDALQDTEDEERVGLVSYASDVTHDFSMTTNYRVLQDSIDARRFAPMPGGTNIAGGIRAGTQMLTRPGATRPNARKVMVLMTDGQWNVGGTPIPAAQEAARQQIVIFTVTFSDQANQRDMKMVAEITGGQHYHAPTADDLRRIFREIANGLEDLVFVE